MFFSIIYAVILLCGSIGFDEALVEKSNLGIFVPFGRENGDSVMDKNDDEYIGPIIIPAKFPFFHANHSSVFVSTNGLVTFGSSYSSNVPKSFPSKRFSGLSVFWNDISTRKGGDIFYRQINVQTTLDVIASEIRSVFSDHSNFQPSFVFVATWYEVAASSGNVGLTNTFQAVIITDGEHSFGIFNYDKLEWSLSENIGVHALVGYNAGDGAVSHSVEGSMSSHIVTLTNRSNVGVPGKFIFEIGGQGCSEGCCDTMKVMPKIFVPFGVRYGDVVMQKTANGYNISPFHISTKFPFFKRAFSTIYVGTNGRVTFGSSYSSYVPWSFLSKDFSGLSVFWSEIDNTKSCQIFYRQVNDQITLDAIADQIRGAFLDHSNFQPSFAFVATWFEVASLTGNLGLKNTFQAVITTDGEHSFAIFNYHRLGWSISKNMESHALVGYNTGDGVVSYTVEGSNSTEILTLVNRSNVGVPGKFIFKVAGGCSADSIMPMRPGVVAYTDEQEIEISGQCLNKSDEVLLLLTNRTTLEGRNPIRCTVFNRYIAKCKTPFFNRLGIHDVKLLVNGTLTFKGSLIVRELEESETIFGLKSSYEVDIKNSSSQLIQISWDGGSSATLFQSYSMIYSMIDDQNRQTSYQVLAEGISSSATDAFIDLNIILMNIRVWSNNSEHFKAIFKLVKNVSGQLVSFKTHVADIWNVNATKMNDCDAWHKTQPDPWPVLNSLLPCPRVVPSSFPRHFENFQWDSTCNPKNTRGCDEYHPGSHGCYRDVGRPFTGRLRPGQQCCYSQNGVLNVGTRAGGSFDSVNPSDDILEHFEKDVVPWRKCCVIEDKCFKYFEKRPPDDGSRWGPPASAGGSGDPHFFTFDGLSYTFNGFGDHTLLRVDKVNLEIQVRLLPYKYRNGIITSNGTVITAVAVKALDHDSVQIELNEANQLIFYLNGVVFDSLEDGSLPLKGVVVAKSQDHYWIQYSVGVSIKVSMTPEKDALSIVVTASRALNGKTKGLLGVMDQDINNDFTLPSGEIVNVFAANDRLVFEMFARHWHSKFSWYSVFTYMNENEYSYFNKESYKPKFISDGIEFKDWLLEQNAESLCEYNQHCLFDVATTRQLGIGSLTLEFEKAIKESEKKYKIAKQTCVRLFDVFENGRRTIRSLGSGYEYTASCNKDFCFEHDQELGKVTFRCEKGEYSSQIPRCVRCCTTCNSQNFIRVNTILMAAMLACICFLIAIF